MTTEIFDTLMIAARTARAQWSVFFAFSDDLQETDRPSLLDQPATLVSHETVWGGRMAAPFLARVFRAPPPPPDAAQTKVQPLMAYALGRGHIETPPVMTGGRLVAPPDLAETA